MREIKFRAWHKSTKTMLGWETVNIRGFVEEIFNNPNFEPLQYTCLKDKHGKEIYEGNILSYRDGKYLAKVEWDNDKCGYFSCFIETVTIDPKAFWMRLELDECDKIEVIGNIYENPELLEEH